MKERTLYNGFIIEAEASKPQALWTWRCWLEKPDGAKLGVFLPEGPEVHHSAESALSSATANGKRRIDNETRGSREDEAN